MLTLNKKPKMKTFRHNIYTTVGSMHCINGFHQTGFPSFKVYEINCKLLKMLNS